MTHKMPLSFQSESQNLGQKRGNVYHRVKINEQQDKMAMVDRGSLPQSAFEYLGARVAHIPIIAEAEIEAAIRIEENEFHRHIYHVIGELTHNAARHGAPGHKISRLRVDHDEIGTFVEVTSVCPVEKLKDVEDRIESCRTATAQEITEKEVRVFSQNLGSNRGGIGLFQVLKSAIVDENGVRQVFIESNPRKEPGLADIKVRVYVWAEDRAAVSNA